MDIHKRPKTPGQSPVRELSGEAIEFWIFDLDNTLYSEETNLFAEVGDRMRQYIEDLLGVGPAEAHRIQKSYLVEFGATMGGLVKRHGVEPREFLDYVHDVDLGVIPPDPVLADSLARLPGEKLVFTNSTRAHAEAVLGRIGAADAISGIFDIEMADFIPKPARKTLQALIGHFGIEPSKAAMIEDTARNLQPARETGMTTIWLNSGNRWGRIGHDPAHIDIEIEDLSGWLAGIADQMPGEAISR